MTTSKKPSLRSRLRSDAATQLGALMAAAGKAIDKIGAPAGIHRVDLAKMIGSSQTDTLRTKLVTQLADRHEAELEKIYNTQLDLLAQESKK